MAQEEPRKCVTVEIPCVDLVCPYCGDEDTHSGAILTAGDDHVFATGETHCDKCERWFNVVMN